MKDVFLRRAERGQYIIPALLKDPKSKVAVKAVLLDLSAKGLRCVTNDRRLLLMGEDVLMEKVFSLEFDFFDVDTRGLEGRVAHVRPGKHAAYERQLGIAFTRISATQARDINRAVETTSKT